jgi:hypothetical protein
VVNQSKQITVKKEIARKQEISETKGKTKLEKLCLKVECTIYLDKSTISTSADGAF